MLTNNDTILHFSITNRKQTLTYLLFREPSAGKLLNYEIEQAFGTIEIGIYRPEELRVRNIISDVNVGVYVFPFKHMILKNRKINRVIMAGKGIDSTGWVYIPEFMLFKMIAHKPKRNVK